jgi:hypothetical protein
MKNLVEGQELSKKRKSIEDMTGWKYFLIIFINSYICLLITELFGEELFSVFNLITLSIMIIIYMIILGIFKYFNPKSSIFGNPGVSYFSEYLIFRRENNDTTIPFFMVQDFSLIDKKKIVVRYKEIYNFENNKIETSFILDSKLRKIGLQIVEELNSKVSKG